MKTRKAYVLFLFSLILLSLLTNCSDKNSKTVAVVNGKKITTDDFRNELALRRLERTSIESAGSAQKFFEAKKDLLNEIIRERILLEEAKKLKINITTDELNTELANITGDYPGDTFKQFLREKGINYNYWLEKTKNSIVIRKLTASITKDITGVSEVEISEFYGKDQSKFTVPEEIHAFQIVVKTEEEAYKILNELRQGKKFEDLAKASSITPEGQSGGEMGYFSRGSMPSAFDNELFKLGQGRISKVVASEYGYHIFKVTDKRGSRIKSLAEARDEIVSEIIKSKKDSAFAEWFKDKIAKAKIERNNVLLTNIK